MYDCYLKLLLLKITIFLTEIFGDIFAFEFHSFSKTYSMAGFRLGFVVGNKKVIEGLLKVKTNIDSGVYQDIQEAGVVALEQCWNDCNGF